MKKNIGFAFIISLVMLLFPLTVLEETPKSLSVSASPLKSEAFDLSEVKPQSFRLYNSSTGEVTEISKDDYIFGVVAAEMPALYEKEALKAQAVAAYTFALKRKAESTDRDYDISDNFNTDQSFITRTAANERWGDSAEIYSAKIEEVLKETDGYIITHNSTPITSVYHALSGGQTESAENIWGDEIPYLKPVSSEGDKLAKDYISTAVFKTDELKEKLKKEITLSGDPSNYFGECIRTPSGTVKSINICSSEISGAELRNLLDLRSANFEVSFQEDTFTFKVYGYGHGVGMSQYGANVMAKQGSDFKEILMHYYSGCKVEKQ